MDLHNSRHRAGSTDQTIACQAPVKLLLVLIAEAFRFSDAILSPMQLRTSVGSVPQTLPLQIAGIHLHSLTRFVVVF